MSGKKVSHPVCQRLAAVHIERARMLNKTNEDSAVVAVILGLQPRERLIRHDTVDPPEILFDVHIELAAAAPDKRAALTPCSLPTAIAANPQAVLKANVASV
ncbi:MAG: hypothetical protein QF609_04385 [Gammaproteobacteria bacterium]|nr:hypothetical protein [Gammaproteobacteria bacterium]HJP37063.1 hypothetical protein [Gammaproteobacteria bacterium]